MGERSRIEKGILMAFLLVAQGAVRDAEADGRRALGCSDQCVRNALTAFNAFGVGALIQGSTRPHTPAAAFGPEQAERLRALLHQSPRLFDLPTSLWTLELAAQVSFAEGLTQQ